MNTDELLRVCWDTSEEIAQALRKLDDWGEAGTRPGQYRSDLVADECGVARLLANGLGVLSEETGLHAPDRQLLAVIDPVDGSTNASRGLPWYATSICVLDAEGPLVSTVVNQATGTRYEAVRGEGARRDCRAIEPSSARALSTSIIGLSGYPERRLSWRQYRALGAAALDLCAVADGTLDCYLDCDNSSHGAWDYLGALLICLEAGAVVRDVIGRDLIVREHGARRSPVAAATPQLLDEILASQAHRKNQ